MLTGYAEKLGKTLRTYDHPGPGDPAVLALEEIVRTRVIASRISHAEARWLIGRSEDAPWTAVPAGADLSTADPGDDASTYWPMLELWRYFYSERPSGFSVAKLSKVLHLKKAGAVPDLGQPALGGGTGDRPAARVRRGRTWAGTSTGRPSATT